MSRKENVEKFVREAMPSQTFEEAKKEFREFYISEGSSINAAEKAFRNLVGLLLKEQEFPEPKVLSRVKDRNECIRKFDGKYRNVLEMSGEKYRIRDHISDLVGVRVVCIYESDIEKVSAILRKEFELIDETDKSKELESTISSFGYKGLHLDLKLNTKRRKLPEYEKYIDFQFEVQIRSIVQDAWSEVDHKLKYKKQTPNHLSRRIAGLAALFEIADREFETIRDLSTKLEEEAKDTTTEIDEKSTQLDLFGFLRVASEYFPEATLSGFSLDTLLEDIENANEKITIADFRQVLADQLSKVKEYMSYLSGMGHSMTPYTQIRHALYKNNSNGFGNMIFDGHRRNFDRWLQHGTVHPNEVVH